MVTILIEQYGTGGRPSAPMAVWSDFIVEGTMSNDEFRNELKRHLWGLLCLFVRYFYGKRITTDALDALIQRAGPIHT